MPKYVCAYGNECPTYGENGGHYYRGLEIPFFTFHDGPCHFCKLAEDEEERHDFFQYLEDLIDRQDMADKAHYERVWEEQNRKEQAAQAERDWQVEFLEKQRKANNERLDREIELKKLGNIAQKEAHSHQLRVLEAEERKRKDEQARLESTIELEKVQIERVIKEIELLKLKEKAAANRPTQDDQTANRRESPASLANRRSRKTKARNISVNCSA